MKRIVFYIPTLEGGGAERNTVLIANHLAGKGHHVFIIVDKDIGPNRFLVKNDVTVLELGGGSHIGHILNLRRAIKKIKPDAIFAMIGLCPIKIFPAALGVMTWRSIILSYHSLFDPKSKPGARMTYVFSSILTRAAGRTLTVSGDIKNELVSRFHACGDRISVVRNPVDLQWIDAKASEKASVCIGDRPFILSVGRLVHQKDYPTLLRAFSKINDKLDLVILGEGPQRVMLEKLASDLGLAGRVWMPGYLSNPFPVYKQASLFVLSSAYEGFGNVLVEAMALGVPVVATRCPGGPRTILNDGRYGRLVPVGDSNAMAQAMLEEIADPVPSGVLKKRASYFNVDCVAAIYLASADYLKGPK